MNKAPRPTIFEQYKAIRELPKATHDRRLNRPRNGAIHVKELEAITQAVLPKGLKANVDLSSYVNEAVYAFRVDYDVYYDLPQWKQTALNSLFATWYFRTGRNGWISPEPYFDSAIRGADEEISLLRRRMLKEYRKSRASQEPGEDKYSLKGKPRRESKGGDFNEFFQKQRREINASHHNSEVALDGYVIDSLPTVPLSLASARTWGIEIEVAGARRVDTPSGWDSVGDGSLESPYFGADNSDCECSCEYCMEYNDHDCGNEECGVNYENDSREFVSPILDEMYEVGIEQICNDVRFEPQNDTAGIHVHVGADNLTPKQIGGLVYGYALLEGMLEDSYKREARSYCVELTSSSVGAVLRKVRTARNKEDMACIDRYVTVNVQALPKHGTIEFRALGPVYESEYIHKWALFCREMVNVAANNVPVKRWAKVKSFEDVMQIFRDYGTELNEIEAVQKAAVENREMAVA